MVRNEIRSEATRTAILAAFRKSFLSRGYDATTTQEVLDRAGLSKGALYHHFASKADVMEAIYEDECRRTIDNALSGIGEVASPLEKLRRAMIAWNEFVRSRQTSRILFEVGPSALGARRAKEIEERYSLVRIEELLMEAETAGEIANTDTALTAAMLNALAAEAALYALRTGKDAGAILGQIIDAIFASLRSAGN